jgi:predicted methyltransferase
MSLLGLGEGAAIADIGAGNGEDTWVFAKLVGSAGTVFAEEIGDGKVKSLAKEAEKRGWPQVRATLGGADDPCLPIGTVDLAFMRQVYHHFTKPREMLRGIWRGLKPGGHLVVIDRNLGTLRDWVPREARGEKHYWIAETTVVREAREEGFLFVACAEKQAQIGDSFVLVFQRPKDVAESGRDPDSFLPLPLEQTSQALRPERPLQRPVFVALGEGRKLVPLILKHASGPGLEIVLEEWATQKDERPPLPDGLSLPSVLTEQGDPHLGPEPIDAVFFLDSFHLLFHGKTLLAKLHERLAPDGRVWVLDREAKEPLSRREASHRRQIEPAVVKQEMAAAGFVLQGELPRPAADRFLLVFGKNKP